MASAHLPPPPNNQAFGAAAADPVMFPSLLRESGTHRPEQAPLLPPRPDYSFAPLEDASEIDKLFPNAAGLAFVTWLVLLLFVYWAADEWVYLQGGEQIAAALAAGCVGLATILMVVPGMAVHGRTAVLGGRAGSPLSGITLAALLTQSVAFVTNCLLAWAPVPVMIDPITYAPVYMVRWCEWTALAGLMTFLSEAIDLRKKPRRSLWPAFTALFQSLSCLCGIVFPYCPNLWSWVIVMIISCVTWAVMFPRAYIKYYNFKYKAPRGNSFLASEQYTRIQFAYHLMLTCTLVWTVLVVLYFLNMAIYRVVDETHWLRQQGLAMMVDTFFDVLAKAVYMKLIVDVHVAVFDREARAQRQLGELRRLMSVLWDSSSDVICISVSHNDKITSMFSPSFSALVRSTLPAELRRRHSVALMLETQQYNPQEGGTNVVSAFYVDSSEIPYGGALNHAILAPVATDSPEVRRALEIVSVACNPTVRSSLIAPSVSTSALTDTAANSNRLLVYPLQRVTGEECRCEMKVSEHTNHALVAVIRDVTERHRRFEAEERAHSETVKRQREAQAVNRFTRHEVKNGLLAGIELVESLKNVFEGGSASPNNTNYGPGGKRPAEDQASSVVNESSRNIIQDMDNMLHEVLDTVLAEAMARDVIHEVYQPRLERVDIKALMKSCGFGLGTSERFPLEISDNMPYLMLDPQLLRYIHRNAFSNACKYGKTGGKVQTIVEFHESVNLFEMKVVNEPGRRHQDLMDMGPEASEAVFRQGSRLHIHGDADEQNVSSGDGAWIMRKCAKTMGGNCRISFERTRTIFSFYCPAEPLLRTDLPATEDFEVPSGTWGIGIDDSMIQRRLMNRILAHAGVEESRRLVLGKDPEDCTLLGVTVRKILKEDEHCKILVLVDENLDFAQRSMKDVVMSGSVVMKDILCSLTPSNEARVFALVRSANDSTEDVALYLQRVHAFFPKAPMQRDRVREILAPLWAERFLSKRQQKTRDISSYQSQEIETDDEGDMDILDEDASLSKDDLLQSLERVDKLLKDKPYDAVQWKRLWGALHQLKGDLMVTSHSQDLEMAILLIASMRGKEMPPEFKSKWNLIRELVVKSADRL